MTILHAIFSRPFHLFFCGDAEKLPDQDFKNGIGMMDVKRYSCKECRFKETFWTNVHY